MRQSWDLGIEEKRWKNEKRGESSGRHVGGGKIVTEKKKLWKGNTGKELVSFVSNLSFMLLFVQSPCLPE